NLSAKGADIDGVVEIKDAASLVKGWSPTQDALANDWVAREAAFEWRLGFQCQGRAWRTDHRTAIVLEGAQERVERAGEGPGLRSGRREPCISTAGAGDRDPVGS